MKKMFKDVKIYHLALPILVSVFPVLFLYLSNIDEVEIISTFAPALIFAILGIVCYIISLLITFNSSKAAIIGSLVSFVILNYMLINNFIKSFSDTLRTRHVVIIIFITLAICCVLIWRLLSNNIAKDISFISTIVVIGLILFNVVVAVPKITNNVNTNNTNENIAFEEFPAIPSNSDLPNIYVLIWDEFAGFNQMEESYNYDNKQLKDFLNDNNFTISYNSNNNSTSTSVVVADFLYLDYISEDLTNKERGQLRQDARLFSWFKEHNYNVHKLSETNYLGSKDNVLEFANIGNTTEEGFSFEEILYTNTLLRPFAGFHGNDYDDIMMILDYLSDSEKIPQEPTFTMMHVTFPHSPFVVDEFGNRLPDEEMANWDDKEIYKGQYIYASTLMMQVLENLITHDPNALIITMSDHGARGDPDVIPEYKTNIFNAFYYNNEDLSAYVDESAVNTMRLLLNESLGTNFSTIDGP